MARNSKDQKKIAAMAKGLKYLVIVIVAVFLGVVFVEQVTSYFKGSEHFFVKEVWISPSLRFINARELSKLKGKSMFAVDLKAIRRQLQSQYPEVDQLRIIRKFPDKIWIVAKRRAPFAFIAANHNRMILDENGVVLSFIGNVNLILPMIEGVRLDRRAILGQPLNKEELDIALDIIKTTQEETHSSPFKISRVDVSNLSRINCDFSNNLRVIMDRDRISQKVRKLGVLFSEGHIDFNEVEYIDLRFREPLLGKKQQLSKR